MDVCSNSLFAPSVAAQTVAPQLRIRTAAGGANDLAQGLAV